MADRQIAFDFSPTAAQVLALDAELHIHLKTCVACRNLQENCRLDERGRPIDDEVCQTYAEKHREMVRMVVSLSLPELEKLGWATRFGSYETMLDRIASVILGERLQEMHLKEFDRQFLAAVGVLI